MKNYNIRNYHVVELFLLIGLIFSFIQEAQGYPEAHFHIQGDEWVSSDNDSISSGIYLAQGTYGMSVSNIDDGSDKVLGNITYTLDADNVVDIDDEEYATWNGSFIHWVYPQDRVIVKNDWIFTGVRSGYYYSKYVSLNINRWTNKSIFNSDGFQLAKFNVTFENSTYDTIWGGINADEFTEANVTFNASILPDTFSTDAPICCLTINEHRIDFTLLDKSLIETNRAYNFSVVIKLNLTKNNDSTISSIEYKPYFGIAYATARGYSAGGTNFTATMPADMLPEHVHYASASTNISNAWSYSSAFLRGMELNEIIKAVNAITPTPTPIPTQTPAPTATPTITPTQTNIAGSWFLFAEGATTGCSASTPQMTTPPYLSGTQLNRIFEIGDSFISVIQSGNIISASGNDNYSNLYTLNGTVMGNSVIFTMTGPGINPGIGLQSTTYTGIVNGNTINGTFSGHDLGGWGCVWNGTFTVQIYNFTTTVPNSGRPIITDFKVIPDKFISNVNHAVLSANITKAPEGSLNEVDFGIVDSNNLIGNDGQILAENRNFTGVEGLYKAEWHAHYHMIANATMSDNISVRDESDAPGYLIAIGSFKTNSTSNEIEDNALLWFNDATLNLSKVTTRFIYGAVPLQIEDGNSTFRAMIFKFNESGNNTVKYTSGKIFTLYNLTGSSSINNPHLTRKNVPDGKYTAYVAAYGDNQSATAKEVDIDTIQPSTLKGDVNGDGQVTVVDALFVAQYTVGLRTLTSAQLAAADVNGDSQVTVVDALFIAQYTVGLRQL